MINRFISKYITHRPESLTTPDMATSTATLSATVEGKSVLVIGGAGSIGGLMIRGAVCTIVALSIQLLIYSKLPFTKKELRRAIGFLA